MKIEVTSTFADDVMDDSFPKSRSRLSSSHQGVHCVLQAVKLRERSSESESSNPGSCETDNRIVEIRENSMKQRFLEL
jgi:hypothetical protein